MRQSRIVGGNNAAKGAYPWIALLGYSYGDSKRNLSYRCAGTLITKLHVITAAHCLNGDNM